MDPPSLRFCSGACLIAREHRRRQHNAAGIHLDEALKAPIGPGVPWADRPPPKNEQIDCSPAFCALLEVSSFLPAQRISRCSCTVNANGAHPCRPVVSLSDWNWLHHFSIRLIVTTQSFLVRPETRSQIGYELLPDIRALCLFCGAALIPEIFGGLVYRFIANRLNEIARRPKRTGGHVAVSPTALGDLAQSIYDVRRLSLKPIYQIGYRHLTGKY